MPASYLPTLPVVSWAPDDTDILVIIGFNPKQQVFLLAPSRALSAGWPLTGLVLVVCASLILVLLSQFSSAEPHVEERKENPINQRELDTLLQRGKALLDVNGDQFDESIRHCVVKSTLADTLKGTREVRSIPLAARRRSENKKFVT